MDITKKETRLLEAVDKLGDAIVDFTARLVREKSTLGNEQGVMKLMEKELLTLSFSPVRVPIAPYIEEHPVDFAPVPWDYADKFNVVGKKQGQGKGKSLLFNGHLDVVSPEPLSFWDHDPFDPVIRDGWMYGRGAGDMKAGVAAMVYAAHAAEKAGFGFMGDMIVEGVVEEECTGNGAAACVKAGYDADAVWIPEPFGPTILTAQLGVLWFKVMVKGAPRHVLEAGAGENAVEKCFPLISGLRELEAEMNAEEPHPDYAGINHPLNLNVGVIKGGDWPSTVPAEAEFHARMSFYPGMEYEKMCERIEKSIDRAAQNDPWLKTNPPVVEFYGFRSGGHSTSMDIPPFRTMNDCHKALFNADAGKYISTCTTDARAFHAFGKGTASCYGPVAENIHAHNERVNTESIINTARAYALYIARWCGLAE